MGKKLLPAAGMFLLAVCMLTAEPPLDVANAKRVREELGDRARTYLGVPYVYGGNTRNGLDCSGFIFNVYHDVLNTAVPRTVKSLYSYAERIDFSKLEEGDLIFFNTDGPLSHIGLYLGDDRFVHAASGGRKTGVIVSSLDQSYYRKRIAAFGRLIPESGLIGILVRLAAAPTLGGLQLVGSDSLFRGGTISAQAWYRLFGMYLGAELKIEYDAALSHATVPLLLNIAFDKRFWFIGGMTLPLWKGRFEAGGTQHEYRLDTDVLFNTYGVGMQFFTMRVAGVTAGIFSELTYTHLLPVEEPASDFAVDTLVGLRGFLGVNVQLRY